MKLPQLIFAFCVSLHPIINAQAADTGPLGFGSKRIAEEMETDRPDFTEGASTVSPGHLQIEIGYLFTHDKERTFREKEHTAPQFLGRVGLLNDLEFRVAWDGYINSERRTRATEPTVEETTEGTADLSLGLKHQMYQTEDFSFSFIAQISTPSGSTEVSSQDTIPEVKLIWAYELTTTYSLAGNINFSSPVQDSQRYFENSNSLAIARGIGENFGTYLEYFGFFPNSSATDSTSTHYLNGGFTFAASRNLQFDILAGIGLNREASDFFSGLGLAFRY